MQSISDFSSVHARGGDVYKRVNTLQNAPRKLTISHFTCGLAAQGTAHLTGGMPVILDDIADVMSHHSIREIKRKTGLRKSRIYSLRCGCTFHLDYDLVVALKRLGYEIKLEKTSGIPDT